MSVEPADLYGQLLRNHVVAIKSLTELPVKVVLVVAVEDKLGGFCVVGDLDYQKAIEILQKLTPIGSLDLTKEQRENIN